MTKEENIINYEDILAGNDPPRELFAFMSDFDGFFLTGTEAGGYLCVM